MKNIYVLLSVAVLLFLGLNYRQLYSVVVIQSESRRLTSLASSSLDEYQNPNSLTESFDGGLSSRFWKFSVIDGGGKVSNKSAWHSASMTFDHGLTINHVPDPQFKNESVRLTPPAAEQYTNVALIGGSGFQPTASNDVVLRFSSRVSDPFYGTAGVIFQPTGTLRKDGWVVKPFDMFGFSVAGAESSIQGVNGPFCYLALNWIPVKANALPADASAWHDYEIRLRWISKTEWLGTVKVDQTATCQISMPAFGPVEVQVWSDNSLVIYRPRRWWEIAPSTDLKFQDGGEKQFYLRTIQISAEAR
jgi:hypothetical protein